MSWLQRDRGTSQGPSTRRFATTRRGATALVVAAGLVVGVTALVPTAGADQIADKQAEAAKVADQLDALKSRQMDVAAQAERVRYERQQAELKVNEAQVLLDETNAELDQRRDDVREVAVEAYQNGNDSPELDAFLTSDANAGLQKRSYLETRTGRHARRRRLAVGRPAEGRGRQGPRSTPPRRPSTPRPPRWPSSSPPPARPSPTSRPSAPRCRASSRASSPPSRPVGPRRPRPPPTPPPPVRPPPLLRPPPPPHPAGRRQGRQPARSSCRATRTRRPSAAAPRAPSPAALSRVGVGDYVWGASGPIDFDCSGLVAWAYAQAGVPGLPHYSGAQYAMTTRISRSQLQPGDLVFWGRRRLRARGHLHGWQPARARLRLRRRRGRHPARRLVEARHRLRPPELLADGLRPLRCIRRPAPAGRRRVPGRPTGSGVRPGGR